MRFPALFFALTIVLSALLAPTPAGAAPEAPVPDPDFLSQYAETYRFRLGKPASIKISPDDETILFLRSGPRDFSRALYEFDASTGKTRQLLTAERLLGGEEEELSEEEKARRERMRLSARGIATYTLSKDGGTILLPLGGRIFLYDREADSVRELKSDAGYAIDPQLSPDASKVACVRDGDLYVIDVATGRERRLTEREDEFVTYGLAEFVAQEEMSRRHGFWWSPDSTRIVYQRTDVRDLETMHIADAASPAKPPSSWPYPRPGKPNAVVTLAVMPAEGGSTTWIDWDRKTYEYLATVKWPENAPLTIVVQNREQTEERILAVDADRGRTRTLFVERDEAWIDLDQTMPRWLSDGSGFLWTTERRGAWQVELRDASGAPARMLTPLDLNFQRFVHLHEDRDRITILASEDPTQSHVYAVPIDDPDAEPIRLTTEPGRHGVIFGESGRLHVHVRNTLDGREEWIVKNGSGRSIGRLESVAEEPNFEPNLEFTTIGEDPSFHAVVVRPRDFEAGDRHPVIVHVYGGPTSQMVRKDPSRYLLAQWMADHGYIVVAIDGRGTPGRGRDWLRMVKNDLITIPLRDQAEAVELLAERYPEMDGERIGIFGWSFGGYFSAHAVMQRPDVFNAGVAGAPVAAWEDYDTHDTERYMGLPQTNPTGYRDSNVLTFAERLEKPLLIIHGTADDNVYLTHSLKMVDALFRAGKGEFFDFIPLSGFTHMVSEAETTRRMYERIMAFFDESLKMEGVPAGG